MSPNAPDSFRQREQWQWLARTNGAVSSKRTPPHKHDPRTAVDWPPATRRRYTLGRIRDRGEPSVIKVFVVYEQEPDPERFEQHAALCRRVQGATFRHGRVFGAPVGAVARPPRDA